MKKRVISLVLALTFVFASVLTANAASFTQSNYNNVVTKTPTSVSLKDIRRIESVAQSISGTRVTMVNATKYNGSNTTWVVRLQFGEAGGSNTYFNDYVLNVYPYSWDTTKDATGQDVGLINAPWGKDIAEGTAKFGPNWYYFGVFDDVTHQSCGYIIAERIKRWSAGEDFSGSNSRGVYYNGSYPEASGQAFLERNLG